MGTIKKIFWPISPTESEPQGDQSLRNFFEIFSQTVELEIHPVYVLGADYYLTSEYFEPIDVTALKDNMRVECQEYLKNFSGLNFKEPLVLENQFSAKGAEVKLFCDYVDEQKPDFVAMSSHGRSGWSRTFLGSFTESFLLQSKFPTIVLGPRCEKVTELKSALMPVQLSPSSQNFIENFLDDHRLDFLDKLTLFHKISMVDIEEIAWAPSLYGLGQFRSDDVLIKAKETTEKFLSSFLDHPLSQKRIAYKISEDLDAISDVILKEAKSFDLITMRSEAGTFEANIVGSVTRDVIRASSKPVIVYPHRF